MYLFHLSGRRWRQGKENKTTEKSTNIVPHQLLWSNFLFSAKTVLLIAPVWIFDRDESRFGSWTAFSEQGILLTLHQREDPVRAALARPTPPFHICVSGMSHSQTHLHGLPCLTHTGGLQPETLMSVCVSEVGDQGKPVRNAEDTSCHWENSSS